MAQFYVNNPGNLSDPIRLQLLNQMIFELEHMNGSWGPDGTNYFVRDFIEYEKYLEEADDDGGWFFEKEKFLSSTFLSTLQLLFFSLFKNMIQLLRALRAITIFINQWNYK